MLKVCDFEYKLVKGRLSAELKAESGVFKPGQERKMERTWHLILEFAPGPAAKDREETDGDDDDDDDYDAFDGTDYEPRVYFQCLPFAFRTWRALDGAQYQWKKPWHDMPNGNFFMWEHSYIPKGSLQLTRRKGAKFGVRWTGRADLHINDQYAANVPFEIEDVAEFEGVTVYLKESESREDALRMFAEHFDARDFIPGRITRLANGLILLRFKPRI